MDCPVQEETLLYDFSQQVGDTLETCITYSIPEYPAIITSISEENSWNQNRKVLFVNDGFSSFSEGIGTETDLLKMIPFPTVAVAFEILKYYCVGTDIECNQQLTSLATIELNNQVKIYPNPATDFVHIEWQNASSFTNSLDYILYTVEGQFIQTGKFKKQLNLSTLAKGMYILELEIDGLKTRKKFIKH